MDDGKVLMTNNLPSAVELGMLADPDLRDHSLPWFLSGHPDAPCAIFPAEFIF